MNGNFQLMHNIFTKELLKYLGAYLLIYIFKNMTYAYPLDWSKIP
jgi:hypothetical protein